MELWQSSGGGYFCIYEWREESKNVFVANHVVGDVVSLPARRLIREEIGDSRFEIKMNSAWSLLTDAGYKYFL